MYRLSDIEEEINHLEYSWKTCNTTRQKLLIQEKINIKCEIYQIMKNKIHYYVV